MGSSSGKITLVMAVKIMLMSTGILTIAVVLLVLMPNLLTSATSNIPTIFSTLRGWLRPPYLYFLINAIIATITFLHHNHRAPPPPPSSKPTVAMSHYHHPDTPNHDVISFRADPHLQFSPHDVISVAENSGPTSFRESYEYNDVVSVKDVEVEVEVVGKFADAEKEKRVVDDYDVDESTVAEESTWTTPPPLMRQEALKKVLPERPPPSARFAQRQHRRSAKPPVEDGKVLRVHKPKKHDTLEGTWKAITEGRHVPLNRHLKKSDTWENSDRQIDILEDPAPFSKAVKKSETFKERGNNLNTTPPAAPTKLKKEPSLGQDELNRRVEAFINKFNEDMRLQRQQSMQQFMDMINRAA